MKKIIVIPARYASTRLPGKPLADIHGKPMIQHVYERSVAAGLDQVFVATDDQRVIDAVNAFGGEACMTQTIHQSGTERIGEVAAIYGFSDEDIIVNVQGDEPLIPSKIIAQVADNLAARPAVPVATLATPILSTEELFDPAVTKVLLDKDQFAIYFSKAPIPWYRDGFSQSPKAMPDNFVFYRHIGIYAQRVSFIKRYLAMEPSRIEKLESLEQLRVVWHGEKIHVDEALEVPGPAVDTPEDLQRVIALLR